MTRSIVARKKKRERFGTSDNRSLTGGSHQTGIDSLSETVVTEHSGVKNENIGGGSIVTRAGRNENKKENNRDIVCCPRPSVGRGGQKPLLVSR